MTRIRKSTVCVCACPEREKDGPWMRVWGGPGVGRERGRKRKMKGRKKRRRRKREEGFIAYDCECVDALRRGKDDPLSSGWLFSSKKSKAPRQITINRR